MPTSDSEGFESADEGIPGVAEKKGRKTRFSSSNYSDSAPESDHELKKPSVPLAKANQPAKQTEESKDGWEDFEVDDEEPIVPAKTKEPPPKPIKSAPLKLGAVPKTGNDNKDSKKSGDTGWDAFDDDWGQDDQANNAPKDTPKADEPIKPEIKSVADRLATATVKEESGGWGWGAWGVDSLLSSATAGITTLTNQVSQGITTVLESGIGAPDPAELARQNAELQRAQSGDSEPNTTKSTQDKPPRSEAPDSRASEGDASFPFGSLISGVTKFVETTGTKVISGGLDTLETIGKKTMEVLQDGDPGLAKKRAMLGLDPGDKPVLSQLLREAKERADEEDQVREEKREAKEVHYETLFDDYEGLVHLEALELLSRQVSMRIDERLRASDADKRQDIKETLQQVAELCELPEDEDDDEETPAEGSKEDVFHERLQEATRDLGLKLHFSPLVKRYTEALTSLEATTDAKALYKQCAQTLAHLTALCMELYHKTAEMLLVKKRRSSADEADALARMTVVLTKQIGEIATMFTEKINSLPSENKEQINNYITNVFLEAGNSSTYIQNAFQLVLPILQIGAV
ncbi:unnamed protein product [Plutella xylostella]|uniref:(diamondback moth) hypothetical protein n=1 Tax=Plutella xylostella TaxID=51655 RepID=A0A8S4FKS9_PLUXY|nr:unnamed protein product [Plutella xylostella]